MKKELMFFAFLVSLTVLEAQNKDGDIHESEPIANVQLNPVLEILNNFLPDTIGSYVAISTFRDEVDSSFRGCFKSYKSMGNSNARINVSIRRGELNWKDPMNEIIEQEERLVNGVRFLTRKNIQNNTFIWQNEKDNKIISFSTINDKVSENAFISFIQILDFSEIDKL